MSAGDVIGLSALGALFYIIAWVYTAHSVGNPAKAFWWPIFAIKALGRGLWEAITR